MFAVATTNRGKLREIPGVRPAITGQSSIFGGRQQPIVVNVQGPEASRLKIASARTLEAVKSVAGVAERIWGALTAVIKLEDKVTRQSEALKSQQAKVEDLTGRVIRLETKLELLMSAALVKRLKP